MDKKFALLGIFIIYVMPLFTIFTIEYGLGHGLLYLFGNAVGILVYAIIKHRKTP